MFKFSESAALAIHTVSLLARHRSHRFSNKEISGLLGCSINTLSKVLQRLTRSKIISSVRGPTGGFVLACDPDTTSALEVFEAMDGIVPPCSQADCLLGENSCLERNCILGHLVSKTHQLFLETLKTTMITELAGSMKLGDDDYGTP